MNMDIAPDTLPTLPRREILGSCVIALEWDEGLRLLQRHIAEKRFTRVTFLNANNANIAAREPEFARALEDFLVLPDGIGVDIAARILYGSPFPANLNGTDFIPALLAEEKRPLKVALVGTRRANAEAAALRLSEIAPHHSFVFINDGFFTPEEEPAILSELERLHPDILLVAMGVPRQELWIARSITEKHCTMPIAVGALLDFLSGAVPRAPRWMRRMRIEWVFRLALEPKRLWRRYVLGNPIFLARVLIQKLQHRWKQP
ncbi:WecB/TagA/CpsF family glycosyltransferase [Chelativorans sp. Marseille-P2723]|uniref:WecB/TagA/CpsF family glycosyltransferase n=1 Tax=Chelativorans sp. Marseille-P2723 TaxID=2709133 RepID=UPI00156DB8E1|nr:WecB/TagA/CpsF family glycosyltransferase [Chelativorans sp. Marseille-P2723]